MNASDLLPPAPDLHGELLLDVFTHKSLRQDHDGGGRDNERYAVLGEKVLETAVVYYIFRQNPRSRRRELEEELGNVLCNANYEAWTAAYRLREKIRFSKEALRDVYSPEGTREIFHAYVGGAFTQAKGSSTVNDWIERLIEFERDRNARASSMYHQMSQPPPPSTPYPVPPPPPPRLDDYSYARSSNGSSTSSRHVSMILEDHFEGLPNLPAGLPNPPNSGKPFYLPKFNEFASQRGYSVQYPAEQTGLQHSPRWMVRCVVNGKEEGVGAATTKQLAKEEAAKQAFHALRLKLPSSREIKYSPYSRDSFH